MRDALVAMSGVTRDEVVAMSGVRRGVEVAKPQKRSNPAHALTTRGPLRRRTRWACCFLAKQKVRQLRDVCSNPARLVFSQAVWRLIGGATVLHGPVTVIPMSAISDRYGFPVRDYRRAF
jgi:hypothetical protein